jgi:subtilisin family serine protease
VVRALLAAVGSLVALAAGSGEAAPERSLRPTGVLVRVDRAHEQGAAAAIRRAGGELVSRRLLIWRVSGPDASRIAASLQARGLVRASEPDRVVARVTTSAPPDPLVGQEWWQTRVGADAEEAPGPGVPVTVVDSGLDVAHPEFAGRPGTVIMNAQTLVGERAFHGTAVASVVAAPVNGVGLAGVYPDAVLRIWDASPEASLRISDVIAGIEQAAALGPGIINLSLGGSRSRFEADAIADAYRRGSIVVAAAGNGRADGAEPTFPANLPHVLTVASSGPTDTVSSFSRPAPGMDVAAPGEQIPVALAGGFGTFSTLSGTSLAAPIVSGAAAWIWTRRPELGATQLFELVRRAARDIPPAGRDADTGFGLLDIPAALAAPAPAPDPLEPNESIEQVGPGGSLADAVPALTDPARTTAQLTARLDVVDDPRDIYRIWVPARGRTVVTVRSKREIRLKILEANLASRTTRSRTRLSLTVTNATSRGRYTYLNVFLPLDGTLEPAAYALTVSRRG